MVNYSSYWPVDLRKVLAGSKLCFIYLYYIKVTSTFSHYLSSDTTFAKGQLTSFGSESYKIAKKKHKNQQNISLLDDQCVGSGATQRLL